MTVGELKEVLNSFDDNLPVCIPTKLCDSACALFDYASVDDLHLIDTVETGMVISLENNSLKDTGGEYNGI